MADFVSVANVADIGDNEMAAFDVSDVKVSIANVSGTFYAFDDVCTHQQCSLAEGELESTTVTCPCHGSQFDVVTGAVLNPPAVEPVKTYPLRVEGDQIEVQV